MAGQLSRQLATWLSLCSMHGWLGDQSAKSAFLFSSCWRIGRQAVQFHAHFHASELAKACISILSCFQVLLELLHQETCIHRAIITEQSRMSVRLLGHCPTCPYMHKIACSLELAHAFAKCQCWGDYGLQVRIIAGRPLQKLVGHHRLEEIVARMDPLLDAGNPSAAVQVPMLPI